MKIDRIFDMPVCRYSAIPVVLAVLALPLSMQAQSDSALNRSVTVERDFQPVIQAASKVSTKPAVVTTTIEPASVEYSDYTADVNPEAGISPMLSQPTRFAPSTPFNGYIRGGLGHPNTLFDFGYHLDDGKKSVLDVYAHHKAEWGLATLSKTKIGILFTHNFANCDLYFGVNGGNLYYHKYGHFYDYTVSHGVWEKNNVAYPKPHTLGAKDKTALWTTEVFLGVKSNAKQDVQYCAQTGYMLFAKPGAVAEHQLRTKAFFDWHSDVHHVGANLYMQNNFLQVNDVLGIPDSLYNSRHSFRIEPYYAYEGSRVRVHVGVNLDMNIGSRENDLIGSDHFCFAPSPHINLEAQVAKQWLTIYADILGNQGVVSLQHYMEENRYRLIHAGIIEPHAGSYTPVDAELGFHIRPHRDLLIELHGGYAYMMNQDVWIANTDSAAFAPLDKKLFGKGDFGYFHATYQRGKIGGQINYHYRDIVRINFDGDYYIWKGDVAVYDRPNWELGLRVDGRIDKHWSLYSANHFAGSRLALCADGSEVTLKPIVELDLGLEYNMWVGKVRDTGKPGYRDIGILKPEPKPNLTFFLQLNNWLHRKNEYIYGYRSQGINFLLGATFRF